MAKHGWTLTRLCQCCGRPVVLLMWSDPETGVTKRVVCYAKTWDGNPWYVPGHNKRHPVKRFARRMEDQRQEARKGEDPFFHLD